MRGQAADYPRGQTDARDAVVAAEIDAELAVVLLDVEMRVVVDAGEDAAAGQDVEARGTVAPRDVDALAGGAVWVIPLHGDAVGGVFGAEAEESGEATRADLLQADQADAGDAV